MADIKKPDWFKGTESEYEIWLRLSRQGGKPKSWREFMIWLNPPVDYEARARLVRELRGEKEPEKPISSEDYVLPEWAEQAAGSEFAPYLNEVEALRSFGWMAPSKGAEFQRAFRGYAPGDITGLRERGLKGVEVATTQEEGISQEDLDVLARERSAESFISQNENYADTLMSRLGISPNMKPQQREGQSSDDYNNTLAKFIQNLEARGLPAAESANAQSAFQTLGNEVRMMEQLADEAGVDVPEEIYNPETWRGFEDDDSQISDIKQRLGKIAQTKRGDQAFVRGRNLSQSFPDMWKQFMAETGGKAQLGKTTGFGGEPSMGLTPSAARERSSLARTAGSRAGNEIAARAGRIGGSEFTEEESDQPAIPETNFEWWLNQDKARQRIVRESEALRLQQNPVLYPAFQEYQQTVGRESLPFKDFIHSTPQTEAFWQERQRTRSLPKGKNVPRWATFAQG